VKKKVCHIVILIVVIMAVFLIGTGFQKRTDVVLGDYSVSSDGTKITLYVGVSSSMGYVRTCKETKSEEGSRCLTFYSTFGGLNSSFGAKNSFVLELEPEDTKIYFQRQERDIILIKDELTSQWEKEE